MAFFKIAQKSFLALPNGGTPPYTITLQNAPTEITNEFSNFSSTYLTGNQNGIAFDFKQAKSASNKLCELASGGSITNTTPVNGVYSLVATFTGNISVKGSVTGNDDFEDAAVLISGEAYVLLSSYDFISLVTTSQTTIDQFSLVYTCTPTAHFETTKRYEAEDTFVLLTDGDFSGRYINNPSASGGKLMGNLDVGDTFHVRHFAPIAGIRTIRTLYVNGTPNQQMCYGVNGGKIMIDIPAQVQGSWDFANSSLLSFTANLRQGWNDIVFGCTGGYAQYDYFEVVGTDARYDSSKLETLASHAMVYAVECEKEGSASRSRGWGYDFFANSGIGLEGDDNNGFTAVFNNMKAGTYNVKFVYGVDHAMTVRVSVNSGALNVVNLTGGPTWHALVEQTIECTFVEGTNTVRILRNGSWCNFDAVYVDIK